MKKNLIITTSLLASAMLLISSCQKNIDKPFNGTAERSTMANANAENSRKLYVSTLDELYAAVNNPDNAGVSIVLSPGVYVLNAAYPNGGRLELQTDMSLSGQPGNTNAVLIDQSSLPFASFRLSPTVTVAPIRVGRGTNSLEWLSVKGGTVAANPLAAIESDLISTETNVIISHVNVDCNGGRVGILFRNRLEEHANRVINATLEYTEISNAFSNPATPGAGLALQNRISGADINLNMQGNYIHGCRIGILYFQSGLGNPVDNCTLELISHNDRIEGNGCGIDLSGGSGTTAAYSNNGIVTAKIYAAEIKDNGVVQLTPNNGAHPGGIDIAGAWGANSSNNILTMSLFGCHFLNNNAKDIYAYGAFSPTLAIAGTNNLLNLYLYGSSTGAVVETAASSPVEPAGTNIVNVVRN